MRKPTVFLLLVGALIAVVFSINYLNVGKPLSTVLESDPRNSGILIKSHYQNYVVPSVLTIDVESVSGTKSPSDVFRVLLQYASKMKDRTFNSIFLKSKGKTKFVLEGDYFKKLGREYEYQNPVYTMRTFPEQLYTIDGHRAFGSWTGGFIGVTTKQIEDFTEFHNKWYIEDMR